MSDTPDIRLGTVLAIGVRNHGAPEHIPKVHLDLYIVNRLTTTQAVAVGARGEIRVRIEDLKVIGLDYTRAEVATDEMVATTKFEKIQQARYRDASRKLSDLIDVPEHRLKLSVAQMEALAAAWDQIKNIKG